MTEGVETTEDGTPIPALAFRQVREDVHAAAVRWLIRRGSVAEALALSEATLTDLQESGDGVNRVFFDVELLAPGEAYDALLAANERTFDAKTVTSHESRIEAAFRHALGGKGEATVSISMKLEPASPSWKSEVRAWAEGDARNQGALRSEAPMTYNGLRYRSHSERVVAQELDRQGVLFFPLPAASRSGVVREPDFLVVHQGKVGILEVHGSPYHPASRAADDHKRNFFFRESGIVVEVFDANDVRANPKLVVDKFLALLRGPTR